MVKKLLTFLGTYSYEETIYYNESKEVRTVFVQEALCEMLGNEVEVLVFLTEEAKSKNWLGQGMKYNGLEQIFKEKNMKSRTIDIKDGKSEEELWDNFDVIYNSLDDKDEVYIDVTYSLRYLPIMLMSVLNYARFIKNISIIGIYYGAYDPENKARTPIFDLTLFNKISDWTVGAEKLITTGDGEKFSSVVTNTINPMLKEAQGRDGNLIKVRNLNNTLKDFSCSLKSSRGNKIPQIGYNLKNYLLELKDIEHKSLKPFEKIVDKILEKVDGYSNECIIKDIHNTICLCRDFKLIQQAYTLLRENIVNYVCKKAKLPLYNEKVCIEEVITPHGIDKYKENSRKIAEKILHSFHQKRGCKAYKSLRGKEIQIRNNLESILKPEISEFFRSVSDDYRNDLNHGGYRQGPKEYKIFVKKLDKLIEEAEKLLF